MKKLMVIAMLAWPAVMGVVFAEPPAEDPAVEEPVSALARAEQEVVSGALDEVLKLANAARSEAEADPAAARRLDAVSDLLDARVRFASGNLEDAARSLESAVEPARSADDARAAWMLGRVFLQGAAKAGDEKGFDAVAAVMKGILAEKMGGPMRFLVVFDGRMAFEDKDLAKGEEEVAEGIRRAKDVGDYGQVADRAYRLAYHLRRIKDQKAGVECLERLRKLVPDSPATWPFLGTVAAVMSDFNDMPRAQAAADAIVALSEDDAGRAAGVRALHYIAYRHRAQKHNIDAAKALHKAESLAQKLAPSTDMCLRRGAILTEFRRFKAAERVYRVGLDAEKDGRVTLRLAGLLAKQGRTDEAEEVLLSAGLKPRDLLSGALTLERSGAVKRAAKVLGTIPEQAISDDAHLADKVKAMRLRALRRELAQATKDVAHFKRMIALFKERAGRARKATRDAKAKENAARAEEYRKRAALSDSEVRRLRGHIKALEK